MSFPAGRTGRLRRLSRTQTLIGGLIGGGLLFGLLFLAVRVAQVRSEFREAAVRD